MKPTRTRTRNRTDLKTDMVCPKCGAVTVVAMSHNTLYLGCSNYPNCLFKQDLAKLFLEGSLQKLN